MGIFDCETFEMGSSHQLRDILIHFTYESQIAGVFNGITFTYKGVHHSLSDSVEKNVFVFDILPSNLPNKIDQTSGLIKPPSILKEKNSKVEVSKYWDLKSYLWSEDIFRCFK